MTTPHADPVARAAEDLGLDALFAPEEERTREAPPPLPEGAPPPPATLADTGLSAEAVRDLLLKILYVQGARTGKELVDVIRLPFPLVDNELLTLQQMQMVEVRGTGGLGRGGYVFDLGGAGRARAREALESSQYVGAAPVPLEQYRRQVQAQSVQATQVTRERLEEGFRHVVLPAGMLDILGPAVNSGRSLFLYGDPGNGKTLVAESIPPLLGGDVYVPHAVDINGQILMVFDPVYHHPVEEDGDRASRGANGADGPEWLRDAPAHDRRFVRVRRPVVVTGGELTLEQLDLQYDTHTKMYQAPFQMKANGGVLIVDDFGRQRVRARDLLNRWIVPLEKRIDYLTLHTGVKFSVPFDALLVFSTNLNPESLAEEAFWRRIHYKVYVSSPHREAFTEIFRRCCEERGIEFSPAAIDFLYANAYADGTIHPRGCHPRDLLDHLCDVARFRGAEPQLDLDLLGRACASYFIDAEAIAAGANAAA